MIGEEVVTFWYRSVDLIVKNLLDNDWRDVGFDEIHVVFGGDHGQGVFGAAVKVILFKKDGQVLRDAVEEVGHVDCKKDTYGIIEKTIAKPLNESLERLNGPTIRVPNNTSVDDEIDSISAGAGGNDNHSVSIIQDENMIVGDGEYVPGGSSSRNDCVLLTVNRFWREL